MSDYELSVTDRRKNAVRLARSAIEKACKDSVVRQQLEALDDVPCTSLMQEIYKAAGLELIAIATSAECTTFGQDGEPHTIPNYPARLKALEILADQRMREAELVGKLAELQSKNEPKRGGGVVQAQIVTHEELALLEEMHRAEEAANTEG